MSTKKLNYSGINYESFQFRQPDNEKHRKPLVPPKGEPYNIINDTQKLFTNIFCDHKAVYQINNPDNWFNEENLAHIFFCSDKNYYSIPEIKCVLNDQNKSPQEFIQNVFIDSNKKSNKISYLLGDVGSGKTAYINYLITKYLPEKKSNLLFIKMDVEEWRIIRENNPIQTLIEGIIEKFIKIIEKHFTEYNNNSYIIDIRNHISGPNKNFHVLKKSLRTFIEENNLKLVIIIDNIDILYQYCKRGFYNDEDSFLINSLNDVIRSFTSGKEIELSNLNANFLFVMRNDTYQYLRLLRIDDGHSSNTHEFDDNNRYEIQAYEWEKIVNGRFAMLSDIINDHHDTFPNSESILKQIVKSKEYLMHNKSNLLETIKKLANSGLREMMAYLYEYSYVPYFNIDKFIESVPVGLLAYVLNGKRLYSNVESHIINIYSNYYDKTSKRNYWLKYLIIKYLEKRKKVETVLDDIIYTFCPSNKGFSKSQVLKVIEELSKSNTSNIIDIKKEYDLQKKETKIILSITEKGLFLINQVFDKFYYLQLIVDDPELMLPESYINIQYFDYEFSDDYSYILLQGDKYLAAASRVIRRKGHAVILFLTLLKVSLVAEKVEYKTVFDQFEHQNLIPDIDSKILSIKNELKMLFNNPIIKTTFGEDFNSYIEEIDIDAYNKEEELKKTYLLYKK